MSSLHAPDQAFVVDTTQLPLVSVSYPPQPTEASYQALFDTLNEVCRHEPRVAQVIDYRGLDPLAMTAAIRQSAARAFFDGIDGRRRATICEARVVTNALTRGIIVAFDWITGAKWPCASFATLEEASAWCQAQIAADEDHERPSGLHAIAETRQARSA